MKKSILLFALLFFLFSRTASAQNKEGYTWVLGYPPDPCCPAPDYFGGSVVSFKTGAPVVSKCTVDGGMVASVSMSGLDGDLLFYSNGCEVHGADYQIIDNGNAVSAGTTYDLACLTSVHLAYGVLQGRIALPWPRHLGQYKFIYLYHFEPYVAKNQVNYATIDMRANNGAGAVTEKNLSVYDERSANWYMTAVRHGNGQDWWVTLPEYRAGNRFVYLLDSLGVHGPDVQEGVGLNPGTRGYGQCAFSPDGSKYAEVGPLEGQILDFDRCKGKFSGLRAIQFDTVDNTCAGVAFSPDSRYLYVSRTDSIYQYDLSAADFNASRLTIAFDEGGMDSAGLKNPYFYSMLLGPDGKIYIGGPGVTKALHIIHHPNERGAACGFERWGLELPTLHYGQLPNLPNFKLGAAAPPCSDCGAPGEMGGAAIFPNPATDYVVVSGTGGEGSVPLVFQLYDALGRLLIEEELGCLPARVELGDLPDAGYFYRVLGAGGGRIDSGTLAKVRGR